MSSIIPEQQPTSGVEQTAPAPDMEAVQAQLDALAQQMKAGQTTPQQQPVAPEPGTGLLGSNIHSPSDLWIVQGAKGAVGAVKGAGEGALKGIFETKDFLFGEPAPEDRWYFRSASEEMAKEDAQNSMVNGVSQSVGQFVSGMLGAGKLIKAAKMLPKVGTAIGAAGEAIRSIRGGAVGAESAKAAVVGATVFDPHEHRLSNIIQEVPWLANPVNSWLAASPDDTAAEGRFKTALESLGMDAIAIPLLVGLRALKGIRLGDTALIDAAEREAHIPEQPKVADTGGISAGHPAERQGPGALDDTGTAGGAGLDRGGALVDNSTGKSPAAAPSTGADPGRAPGDRGGHLSPEASQGVEPAPDVGRSSDILGNDGVRRLPDMADGGAPGERTQPDVALVQSTTGAQAQDVAAGGRIVEPAGPFGVTEADLSAVEKGLYEDGQAILDNGGNWLQAVDTGHPFANSAKIPYQKLGTPDAVGNLITDLTDAAKPRFDAGKGGGVLSDAAVAQQTEKLVSLFNGNPADAMALLAAAGDDAGRMTATMNTAYLVAARAFADAHKTLNLISARLIPPGMTEAMVREQAIQQLDVAAAALNHANSIKANAARSMRQMRPEFAVTADQLANVRSMDQDLLVDLIMKSKGDIGQMAKVVQRRSWVQSVSDWGQYLLVNNLLWGWKTHLVNLATNVISAGIRPAERMVGHAALGIEKGLMGDAAGASKSFTASNAARRAYGGMLGSYLDGWRGIADALLSDISTVGETFLRGDSALSPHNTELLQRGAPGAVDAFLQNAPYRPIKGFSDILYNAHVASWTQRGVFVLGTPTRALGAIDEAVKTIVSRGYVVAKATEEGAERGLTGQALKGYVKSRLDGAIDDMGRLVDVDAKLEAQTATFSQELLPGTWGRDIQHVVAQHPASRLIIPFVKTPTNVLRMGIKYVPGLNMAQQEYRQMLSGELGADRAAQAMGQMAVGSLLMGAAAALVSTGRITGGGPANRQLRSEMMAKGWQPYSLVTKNEDGTNTYFPLSRFDPFGIHFGIIADLQDYLQHRDGDDPGFSEGATGLFVALLKNISNRTYLQGISNFIDVASDPGSGDKASNYLGQQAANFVPASSMLRQINPDPYTREARGLVDKVMATLPGFSESLEPALDAFGDPKLVRKGLWSSDTNDAVDQELLRLEMETGRGLIPPAATIDGIDLRDFTLKDGRNAFTAYQQLAGHPPGHPSLKARIKQVMDTDQYERADESSDAPGTKIWMLQTVAQQYRENARGYLLRDKDLRDAFLKARRAARDALMTKKDGAIPQGQQDSSPGGILQRLWEGASQ